MEHTYEELKPYIKQFQNTLSDIEYHASGVSYFSGGFANVDYDWQDDDYVYFILSYGVYGEDGSDIHTEKLKILIEDLLNSELTFRQKIDRAQEY